MTRKPQIPDKETTNSTRNKILSTLTEQLEDVDFVDGTAVLSHTQNPMQDKVKILDGRWHQLGLKNS